MNGYISFCLGSLFPLRLVSWACTVCIPEMLLLVEPLLKKIGLDEPRSGYKENLSLLLLRWIEAMALKAGKCYRFFVLLFVAHIHLVVDGFIVVPVP